MINIILRHLYIYAACFFKLNLYHIVGLDEQTSEFLFWLCLHWLVIWDKSLNFPACLFFMYKIGITPLLLTPSHGTEMRAMFITLFEKNVLFYQTSRYYTYISRLIMGRCVEVVTDSNVGLLSGRDRDFELPEYGKAERTPGHLVSPVDIWMYLSRPQSGYIKGISSIIYRLGRPLWP